jgi:hypothetical protein
MPISTMGNPWWIMADAKFMEGNIGGPLAGIDPASVTIQ